MEGVELGDNPEVGMLPDGTMQEHADEILDASLEH